MRTLGRGSKKKVVRICFGGYLNQYVAVANQNSDERSKFGAVRTYMALYQIFWICLAYSCSVELLESAALFYIRVRLYRSNSDFYPHGFARVFV